MTISQIDKSDWKNLFDQFSKSFENNFLELELNSLILSDQDGTEWIPFLGISYDPEVQQIDIFMEDLGHRINCPKKVFVDQDGVLFNGLEIIDGDELKQVIKLRKPLLLVLRTTRLH